MREIKFRAWDIRLKKMRGVMYLKWFNNGVFRVNATESDENYEPLLYMPNNEGSELKEFELMQYTGLKDKNGKEIYEGDIVKYSYNNGVYEDVYVKVIFNSGRFMLDADHISYHMTRKLCITDDRKCEVVGNIYENQELLERI